jgi:hypothetical protein
LKASRNDAARRRGRYVAECQGALPRGVSLQIFQIFDEHGYPDQRTTQKALIVEASGVTNRIVKERSGHDVQPMEVLKTLNRSIHE